MPRWYPRSVRKRHNVRLLMERDGPICQICGRGFSADDPATIDHIVELGLGGANALYNMRLAHRPCNDARSNDPVRLAKTLGVGFL